ncbi:hypothetical protein BGW80DRAFT_1565082 [Lactifluus volemus]|nr:hypothetical protein BGW80DRAFT_1565082 [Lactifluus volemus]
MDTWAASLDIVVDPPPQSIFCLRRHRLSSGGGGLWLTLLHDAVLAGEGHLMAIVRRGPGRECGVVMLNGSKVSVDVEELPEVEITSLSKQKRIKPPRIPLDQPPVLGAIRRRHRDWNGETEEPSGDSRSPLSPTKVVDESGDGASRHFDSAGRRCYLSLFNRGPSSEFPLQYALNVLQYLQAALAIVGSRLGQLDVHLRKGLPAAPGERVIEGISAEEIVVVVTSYDARTRWDEHFVGVHMLEVFAVPAPSGISAQRTNLIPFLIVLCIVPLPPHWVLNVLAPHLGIGLIPFWCSTFLGIFGITVIHTSIGGGLDEMTSAADFHLTSWRNFLTLAAVVVGAMIPVGI